MQYSKYQRFTSFFILFFFLFSTTFRVPLDQIDVYAENNSTKNIVSIIVEEEVYDSLKGSIATYAENISNVLSNTQVVILPTPKNTTAYEIASLNESLYLEGFKTLNNGSRNAQLVGTLIVGDLSLPIAYENNNAQKTIVPYIDFNDKYFIYNHENGKYEKNEKNLNGLRVEIWHGVVSPNLGSEGKNIQAMNDFFGKTDSFYNGTGLFDSTKGVLNGNQEDAIPEDYEPYVFYFDQIRESKATSLESYRAYQAYLENKEDILYQRYNQVLADKIKQRVLDGQKDSMEELEGVFGDAIDFSQAKGPELLNVPDIQTRHIINKSTKKFVEIFSKGSIGELRKNVHNAGRYNYAGGKVNADFIPYLVTILDSVNDEIIKEANDDLELEIDDIIKNGLSRDIAIPTKYVNTIEYTDSIVKDQAATCSGDPVGTFNCTEEVDNSEDNSYGDHYTNLYYGKQASNVTLPEQCTIFRGSRINNGTIVRANRSYNVETIQSDIDLLQTAPGDTTSTVCMAGVMNGKSLNGYFGRNTGLYLDKEKSKNGELILKSGFDEKGAIVPLFDIKGSKTINETGIGEASYLNCLESSYFLSQIYRFDDNGDDPGSVELDYQIPIAGSPLVWTCETVNKISGYNETYDDLYKAGKCRGMVCTDGQKEINFKQIPSYMEHKSPTSSELSSEIQSGVTPSLPIDKDRYIDFMANNPSYQKVNYEYLFRDFKGQTLSEIKDELKNRLDVKTLELNGIVVKTNGNFPVVESIVREVYEESITDINNSIANELDFEDNVTAKEAEIAVLSGTGVIGGNSNEVGVLGEDQEKIEDQVEVLEFNTVDLDDERIIFQQKRDELIINRDELFGYLNAFDNTLTGGKYCKSGDCNTGWIGKVDKESLVYELSIIDALLIDYQDYIEKIESIVFKLKVQGKEMDFISLKLKVQLENLSQLWSTLEYDKNGISPIYEELNQRIKELDELEMSYEITDKIEEIQKRIDYLFSTIDTLDITAEENDVKLMRESMGKDNENIISTYESKREGNELINEFDSKIIQINEILTLEKELSQKKLELADSIKDISSNCSKDEEGNVDKEKCKLAFEQIEELKISESYIELEQLISQSSATIRSKTLNLEGEYTLGSVKNVNRLIDQIGTETDILSIIRTKFEYDSLNVNNNINSLTEGLNNTNGPIEVQNNVIKIILDKIEEYNDDFDDLNQAFKTKAEEIKIIDDNIVTISNSLNLYLSGNDTDNNPYLELYDFRNGLVSNRNILKIKEDELDIIESNLNSKKTQITNEVLKLKTERIKLSALYNTYNTKKDDRKTYGCIGEVCTNWLTEIDVKSIESTLADSLITIGKYEEHIVKVDTLLNSITINNTEIDELIKDTQNEIDSIDILIFEIRIDDYEYKKGLLESEKVTFDSKYSLLLGNKNKTDDIISLMTSFTELKYTNPSHPNFDQYIPSYTLIAIEAAFTTQGYVARDYLANADISTVMKQQGTMPDGFTPKYVFSHYEVSRGVLINKLTYLGDAKIILDNRVTLSNGYVTDLGNKITEKNDEIINLNNLITSIGNGDSEVISIFTNIKNSLDLIKLDGDINGNPHVDFFINKINVLSNYFSILDVLDTNVEEFFDDKIIGDLISPVFTSLLYLKRSTTYIGSPTVNLTTYKDDVVVELNKVISRINVVHLQFDDIFTQILDILNLSNEIGIDYYENLALSIDSINSGLLSTGNFVFKKGANFTIDRLANDIVVSGAGIKIHIFSNVPNNKSVYLMSNQIWLSLVGIENFNKDEIAVYNNDTIEVNQQKIDEINAIEFYGWTNEEEKTGIIGEGGTDGVLDNDSQELYKDIDDHIVDLRTVEIYEAFKTSPEHPEDSIDLYGFLESKEEKELVIGDDKKTLDYIDSLAFAIYWSNLNSVSAKYKFIFQNYLSDQFVAADENSDLPEPDKFNFPKNKKQYEIAYLGAHGDSENMYVQMNPESKGENPYKDIIQKNANLQSKLLGLNIGAGNADSNNNHDAAVFKCAPPEGVPIYEWIPAVVCWLDDMLPPTITVTESTCGPTIPLLNQEEKEYLAECNGDVNKNAINDCLENKLTGGSVDMSSDGNRYYYNKPGKLTVRILDSSENVLTFNNSTEVVFELLKIEAIKDEKKEFTAGNKEVVYSLGDDESIAKKYINFTSNLLRPKGGVVESFFTTKGIDANYIFQAKLEVLNDKGEKEIELLSEEIKIEVRGDRLFSTVNSLIIDNESGKISSEVGSNEIIVSDKSQIFLIDKSEQELEDVQKIIYSKNDVSQKAIINLENLSKGGAALPLVYPILVELVDDNDEVIVEELSVSKGQLSNFFSFPGVTKTGHFILKITDGNGFVSKKELDFMSEEADHFKLNMGASVMEYNGAVTSNVISILDKFDNIIIGRPYTLDIEIDGDSIVFEHNNEKESSNPVVEGYKIFRLLSGGETGKNTIEFILKDFTGDTILSKETEVEVIEKININIIENNNIKVGGDLYELEIQIVDGNNKVYSDINSRLYFSMNSIYGKTTKPYFEVVNGVAKVEMITTTLATKTAPVEIQIEGLRTIYEKDIKILHDEPAYVQLGMNQYAVEAVEGNTSDIQVFVKDQFGNITFENKVGTASLEILSEYEKYVTINQGEAEINEGVATVSVAATDLPGMAYFKVSVNGHDAVGKIETHFYWNENTIKDTSYNALYTTLLGAPYGDITKENYLAGSLLFDKDNRSLAVTSLLNSPFSRNDVVMIEHNGGISSIANPTDLSTDIKLSTSIENKKLVFSVKNKALGNYIGKIEPILGGSTELNMCHGNNGDFAHCNISQENSSIVLQSDLTDYKGYGDSDSLYIQDQYGRKIFSINNKGEIDRDGKIYFELDETNEQKYLKIKIFSGNNKIGDLIYNLVGADIKTSRNEELFNKTKVVVNNTILLLLGGDSYSAAESYSEGSNNKVIYFNNPLDIDNQLDDFSKGNLFAYENFIEKGGNGWSEGNKSLLQFAAGESVGESVKAYQSFGVINLGDPVLRLKKIRQEHPKLPGQLKKFDSTIGTILSNKTTVESYEFLDYNNNGKQDIILIHGDKYVELLENTDNEKNFRSLGNLAQIYDLGEFKNIKTGDFTGDGYDDIFFVNNQGDPYILNNNEKDYFRLDLREQFNLSGKILQAESFDMDKDGRDDIVTLDDSGAISIMYGSGTSIEPVFKNDAVGIGGVPTAKLNGQARTDRGALYYKGLVSLGKAGDNSDLMRDTDVFMSAVQQNVENLGDYEGTGVNTSILDSMVFVQIPYKFNELEGSEADILVESVNTPLSAETGGGIIQSRQKLGNFVSSHTEGINYPETFPEVAESDFIRSEYSEILDIKIEKVYSGDLKKGSKINFELTITNESDKTLEEVAYVEDIITVFTLDETSIKMSKDAQIRYDIPGYEFLIDDFNIAPGETFTLTAQLTTAPIKLGFMRVGLFEDGEPGDDVYGDIIYSNSEENCSETVDIYRSTAKRTYFFGNKVPVCDTALPESVQKNAEDADNNGIPDYIDDIVNGGENELENYAKGALGQVYQDSDGDGKPDYEDNTSSDKDFLSNLDEINENVDHIMGGIDNIIQGLSCGFGGGGCIATPLNWAPLAPGGDPTLFGVPIGDGLNVGEGMPVFSSLTWMWYGPYCLPSVWPISPLSEGCSNTGAGGYLGTESPSNFFRLFVTPTLTGGMGVAACFGGPAIVAGYANMPGLSPLLPGGNCIVTAMPLASCSSDGSDGDASTLGPSSTSSSSNGGGGDGGVSIINANCSGDKQQIKELDLDLVQEYLDYKTTGNKTENFEDLFKESFSKLSHPDSANIKQRLNEPLITVNGQGMDEELSMNIDFGAAKSGDFSDIIQIQNRRISPFPDFLMGWVTRQIEEIVTKLTDFPTVFIILPDFSGVLDFGEKSEEDIEKNGYQDLIKADGANDIETVKSVNSGIKTAYTFMSNIPLIELQQENLSIEIPWVDGNEVDATLEKWGQTANQWKTELKRAKEAWSLGTACSYTDPKEQKNCEDNNAASEKIIIQTEGLIGSLEQNMEAIKSYKEFPKKLNKLVQKKEDYLEQILCNVEIISEILGGWIGSNGERFKAWVELYILIKAILKSWQLLIDVFVDYEAECSECKNERGDLMTFIWQLISAIIPSIPVIQFPKWPDIIMDLHNIRAGLVITLPEFTFGTRPILLPTLPNLYLPDVPTVAINLPEIPVLPTIEIPELPDLPVLPTVELPNLPPPPTLPKMFASLEGILEILKAITKAMCILKTSPFVPEWRAGDQIAFLTERSGYLPTDFIDLSLPQFSYPFVDAIKVTTYVNLEFETDFVTELARQITMPLTTFSNDFTQILNLGVDDLDFSQIPSHIDVNIGTDGVEGQVGYSQKDKALGFAIYIAKGVSELAVHLENGKNDTVSNSDFKKLVAESLASDVFVSHPKYNSFRSVWDPVFNYSFAKEDKFIADLQQNNFDKFDTLKNILHTEILKNKEFGKNIETYLQPQFIQKVDVKINNDVDVYNKQLAVYNNRFKQSVFALMTANSVLTQVQFGGKIMAGGVPIWYTIVGSVKKDGTLIEYTNKGGQIYADGVPIKADQKGTVMIDGIPVQYTKEGGDVTTASVPTQDTQGLSAQDAQGGSIISEGPSTQDAQGGSITAGGVPISYTIPGSVRADGTLIQYTTQGGKVYADGVPIQNGATSMQNDLQNEGEKLLNEIPSPLDSNKNRNKEMNMATTSTSHVPTGNSCEVASKSPYRYKYKGLYVEMAPKITYRLFDYLDELDGKEEIKSVDIDNDGDSDVTYLMNGQIFIKENLKNQSGGGGTEAITIDSDDNIFYSSKEFISAVDNFREGSVDNDIIDAEFSAVTRSDIFNYRLVFSRLIDRTTKKKSIVDGFSQTKETLFEKENELFIFSKNLAYINKLGKLKDLQLTTKELINIKNDLQNENIVDLSAGTKVYAGKTPVRLSYMVEGSTDIRILIIGKYKNIELKSSIKIVGISGDAYVEGRYDIKLKGEDIRKYLGRPIFPDAHFEYIGNPLSMDPMTYSEIKYYDETEALLNFNFIEEYYLYDLGTKSENYSITLNMKNDYIYATIRSFKENLFSTYSKQIVLSPQLEADNIAPSLFLSEIKIPVYQEKEIDLSDSIYDDGKLAGIKYIGIDMDLEEDSDGDGNTKNDSNIALEKITHTSTKILVKFGIYDSLMKKKIGFTLRDKNDNESFTEVGFEVYAPTPEIKSIKDTTLVGLLDETLDEEPVSLYRYRGGVISKLKDNSGKNKTWTDSGNYDFEIDQNNEGLTLEYAGNTIATIAESTGKITLKDFTAKIKVLSSNNVKNKDLYPKIEIEKDNSAIYYQYLKVSDVDNIKPVQGFNNISDTGIYTKFTDSENYGYYAIPETVSYNPGVFIIYRTADENKEPLFILYPDGRIDTLNEYYTLEYRNYNESIVLKLIDKHYNKEIAQVLFKIDGGYIMK